MNNAIKKLILAATTVTLIGGASAFAFAQGPHGPGHGNLAKKLDGMSEQERLEFMEDRLDERLQKMTKKLNLTADQQAKVRVILADANTQLLELYDASDGDLEGSRDAARAIRHQSKQQVAAVLTDAQRAELAEMKKRKRHKHAKKRLDRLDQELNLTDAQRAEIEAIMKEQHQAMKAAVDSGEKPAKKDRIAARKATVEKIEAVLTPDQLAKFQTMRQEREGRKGRRGRGNGPKGAF